MLLLVFPLIVSTVSSFPLLFYHGGLSGLFVRLAEDGGVTAERALRFLMKDGYFYLAALTTLPLLYLAVLFPRPLTAVDIAMPRRDVGLVTSALRPLRTGLVWLKRVLLRRPLLVAAGVTPAVLAAINLMVSAAAAFVLLLLLALSYLRDGYAASEPAERQRILWVLGGLFVAGIAISAFALGSGVFYALVPRGVQEVLRWLVLLAAPLAFGFIAAGVLYRGAFDPGLVIRRTSVYGALGVLLTMLFAVVEEFTAQRVFEQAGLPDSMGAALAAVIVVAVFRPVRSKLGVLYDAFLGQSAREIDEGEATSLVVARLFDADPTAGVEGLSETALLHRCARRVAADVGGSVRVAEDGIVALEFSEPARAVEACVTLRSRLAATREILGTADVRPGVGVYHPEPEEEIAPGEALEAAHRLAATAEPGEVVLSAGVVAEPGVIWRGRLESVRASGPAGAFRLVPENDPCPGVGSALATAAPVLAGVVVVAAAPLLMLRDLPEQPASEADVNLILGESADSTFEAGKELSREEALALEARLAAEPDDLAARGLLLQYWCSHDWMTIPRWRSHRHALWMLANRSDHPVAFRAIMCVPWRGPAYGQVRRILLDRIARADPTAWELGLAGFVLWRGWQPGRDSDLDRAGRLLERATDRDPQDWRLWRFRGWYLRTPSHEQHDSAAMAFARSARLLPPGERPPYLKTVLSTAWRGGVLAEYRDEAMELRRLARDHAAETPGTTAVFHNIAETALGLISLESDDLDAAVHHLRASTSPPPGAEPPSRVDFALAAALWHRGIRGPVVEYFEWVLSVNDDEDWKQRVAEYLRRARAGKDPGFRDYERRF